MLLGPNPQVLKMTVPLAIPKMTVWAQLRLEPDSKLKDCRLMEEWCHSAFLTNLWKNGFLSLGITTSFIALYLSQMGHLALFWHLYQVPHSPCWPPGSSHLLCHYSAFQAVQVCPPPSWQLPSLFLTGKAFPIFCYSLCPQEVVMHGSYGIPLPKTLAILSLCYLRDSHVVISYYNKPSFHLWHGLVQ